MEATGEYQQFATVIEEVDGSATLYVLGDVDLSCATEFERALSEAAIGRSSLVVDFRQCRYMDSTGLTALVRTVKQHGGAIEAVVAQDSGVARVMQMTGFQNVLRITHVKDEAAQRANRFDKRSHVRSA